MDSSVHPEVAKLHQSIAITINVETADATLANSFLPATASETQKAEWVQSICAKLGNTFDEETIRQIRMKCFCTEEGMMDKMKLWLKGLYLESSSLEDFVKRVNKHNTGWYIKDGWIYTKFLTCECYMLRNVMSLPTKTWCYCTVGYTRELFTHILDCEIESELVQCIKMGYGFCIVKVRKLEHNTNLRAQEPENDKK